jgi:hypothetical protein
MKRLLLILSLLQGTVFAQCNGAQSFTLTPPPVGNQYLPGQVVTMCYTMNGYSQAGSNWIDGFDLTLGPGWANVQPATAPANCGGNASGGQWLWLLAVNTPVGLVGPGYFFDLDLNGNPANDFGDSGSCTWTFCVTLTVAQGCTPQSLAIAVTPGSDGLWGSWNSTSCDGATPFVVFNGTINPQLPSVGAISHN